MTDTPSPTVPPSPTIPPLRIEVDIHHDFPSKFLDKPRTIYVYMPPDYAKSPDRRYPVLYANDGQDMGAVRLSETLENLYERNLIQPVIVVAVSATDDRLHEYGVAGHPNADGLGAQADDYRRYILEELIPFVERTYRLQPGPDHTAVMGWSLGGLSAFDLAWNQPHVFGKVGAFSGSFWWRSDDTSLEARTNSRIAHQMVRTTASRPALRFWFEVGALEETSDRDGNGVIDAIQDTTELIDELAALGFDRQADIRYVEMPDGQHNQRSWSKALPLFLEWAFPAQP